MKPTSHLERSSKEYIILGLSLMSAVSLFPFTVHRLMTEDWDIAALDGFLMLVAASLFAFVYKTRKTATPSLVLSLLFLCGEVVSVMLKGSSQLVWVYPCTVGIYYLTSIPRATAINLVALILVYALVRNELNNVDSAAFLLSLISTNIFTIVFAARNQIQKKQLEELTLKDPVTGVSNRRAFENYLDQLDIYDRDNSRNKALIMFEVENLRELTDIHGHANAEDALMRLVTLLQTQLHSDEGIYNIGTEQYVIAALNLDINSALEFTERLQKIIEHSKVNDKLTLKVNFGVSELKQSESSRDWVRRADQDLCERKEMAS